MFLLTEHIQVCVGCPWPGISSAGDHRHGLCEERPCGRHCWFHPAPTDPPQGTAEPISHNCGASGKKYLRKSKKYTRQSGEGNKKSEKQQREYQSQRMGGVAPGAGADIPLQPWRGLWWSTWIFLRDCSPWRAHTGSEEMCEREGGAERNHHVLIIPPHALPCSGWGKVEVLGVKLGLRKGGGRA